MRHWFIIALCLCVPMRAWATVTKDASTCGSPTYDGTGVAITTGSLTVASHSDRVMYVQTSGRNIPGGDGYGIASVSFNGSTTGWARVVAVKPVALNSYVFSEIWKLDAPTVTSATIVITANSGGTPVTLGGCATVIYNAHQNGANVTGSYDPQSVQSSWNISPQFATSVNDSAIVDAIGVNGTAAMTANTGRVESFNLGVSDSAGIAGSEVIVLATAGGYDLIWTSGAVGGDQVAAAWGPPSTGNGTCGGQMGVVLPC